MFDFASIPKFCISLKNSDRRKSVVKEFEKHGIYGVNFFDAVDGRDLIVPELSSKLKDDKHIAPGILGCMLSHVNLIKKAKGLGLKEICIFEDDVIFCDDFKERISYLEENLPEYDLISLGGHFAKPDRKQIPNATDAIRTEKEHIYKTIHLGGTYAYIITDSVYDFIIRNHTYNFGADQFYSDHVYSRFRCFAFVPFLVACSLSKSEISGVEWNYENIGWFYSPDRIIPQKISNQVIQIKRQMLTPRTQTKAINLLDCTFITAIRIESPDREFNFLRVLQFLCDTFATNIIIKESAASSRIVELLPFIDRKECTIIHTFEQHSGPFHRTRLLNEALIVSQTPCTINYDIDCLMEPQAYIAARDRVVNEGWDLVFPYRQGEGGQNQISVPVHIKQSYKGESLFNPEWLTPWTSYCGHIQFFNTDSYISGGMENEFFISYGPEDREREERFRKMEYKIMWGEYPVYHIEHSRDENSSTANPFFQPNEDLMWKSRNMSKDELIQYYREMPYLKKYVK